MLYNLLILDLIIDESSGALTISGDLFLWGRNKDNLLGLGSEKKRVSEPIRVYNSLFLMMLCLV